MRSERGRFKRFVADIKTAIFSHMVWYCERAQARANERPRIAFNAVKIAQIARSCCIVQRPGEQQFIAASTRHSLHEDIGRSVP